jgi:hypothetical protein
MKPVSSFGYELSLKFIVVEARIEARLSELETRVSSIKFRASIQASSPINEFRVLNAEHVNRNATYDS